SRTTERCGWSRRVKMAVARPAAPPPTIATSDLRRAVYAAAASRTWTLEITPHVLQRTVRFVGSSAWPMISVRWLPHFGQTGGGGGYGRNSILVVNCTMMSVRVPRIGPTMDEHESPI